MTDSPQFVISANGSTVDQPLQVAPKLYTAPNGVRHPRDVFIKWTDAQLAAIGVYRVTADTLSANHTVTDRSYARNGDRFDETITSEAIPRPTLAQAVVLSRQTFFARCHTAYNIQNNEAPMPDFMIAQINARIAAGGGAALLNGLRRVRNLLLTMTEFRYVNPGANWDNGTPGLAVETLFAQIAGYSATDTQSLWIGDNIITINRANCPITGTVTSDVVALAAAVSSLTIAVSALDDRVTALEGS